MSEIGEIELKDFLAVVKEWQDLLAGMFTLVAGALAYYGVSRQIKADKQLRIDEQTQRELAFLTVLSTSITSYSANLGRLEQELIDIRNALPRGADIRERLSILKRVAAFDIEILREWNNYVSLPVSAIETIRAFYDSYLDQQHAFDQLRALVIPSDLPLLRTVTPGDSDQTGFSRIGSLLACLMATRAAAEELNKRLIALQGRHKLER